MARKKVISSDNPASPESDIKHIGSKLNETPVIRSPCFEKKYVTRVLPFFTEFDVRMTLCNETMKSELGWNLVADEMVILTPTAAKELCQELSDLLKAFEELNGPIRERSQKKVVTTFTTKE